MYTIFALASAFLSFSHPHTHELPTTPGTHRIVELGWSAESLVLAGLNTTNLESLVSRCEQAESLFVTLAQCRAATQSASATLTSAQELAWAEPGESERADAVTIAQQAYTAAVASEQAALEAASVEVLSVLEPGQAALVGEISARAAARVPLAWKVVSLSSEEIEALEAALKAQDRAARNQIELGGADASAIAAMAGRQDVIAAEQRLASVLPAFIAAFSAE